MLLEAVLEVIRMAGVIGPITTAQDIDPKAHGGGVSEFASFEFAPFDSARQTSLRSGRTGETSLRWRFATLRASEVEGRKFQIIPIPRSTDSMIAAAMTEPIWPPALALMACISRWFFLL